MAEPSTFIKLDRNIVKWRWFQQPKTLSVFLWLILEANVAEKSWQNITIQRGQLVTSYRQIASHTGLTINEVRTAIKRLISTQEITQSANQKYSLITVLNYDKYQSAAHKPTSKSHTDHTQTTSKAQQYKNNKNIKKDKKERNTRAREETPKGVPPGAEDGRPYEPFDLPETPEERAARLAALRR